jgi:hypothetical protein
MLTGHRDTETQRTFAHVVCMRLCVAGAIEGVLTLCCVCSSHSLAISGAGMPAGGGRSEHAAASRSRKWRAAILRREFGPRDPCCVSQHWRDRSRRMSLEPALTRVWSVRV